MPSPWTQRMVRENRAPDTSRSSRAQCAYRAMPGRAFTQCSRLGNRTVIANGEQVTRPLCWQHGRMVQDMHTAAAIGTDRIVRLEVIR